MPTPAAGRLNDLTGKEWLVHTKTVMLGDVDRTELQRVEDALETGVMLSQAPPRDVLKKSHPATFSEKDAAKLVRFFTKENETVMDPFLGSGSTAIACLEEGRHCIGLELYSNWVAIARKRVANWTEVTSTDQVVQLRCVEALAGMADIDDASIDFVLTSPPYWKVLGKVDHKAKRERLANELETVYGNDPRDLANVAEYAVFLQTLKMHFGEYARLLKPRRYAAVIVSDFRHHQRHYLFHAHVAELMEMVGFITQSVVNLVQDGKRLYPYGYPTTLVPNITNQYIVIGRKL